MFALSELQVAIFPEVASRLVNRAIMAQLVKLYRGTDLGMRLPAYDGRKSLYTAGLLPFTSKEFHIKIALEDDGMSSTRLVGWILFFCLLWNLCCYVFRFVIN